MKRFLQRNVETKWARTLIAGEMGDGSDITFTRSKRTTGAKFKKHQSQRNERTGLLALVDETGRLPVKTRLHALPFALVVKS